MIKQARGSTPAPRWPPHANPISNSGAKNVLAGELPLTLQSCCLFEICEPMLLWVVFAGLVGLLPVLVNEWPLIGQCVPWLSNGVCSTSPASSSGTIAGRNKVNLVGKVSG